MTSEKKKEGEFDPACVRDIYDKLQSHNFALRAFGALLRSSHLDDFADEGLATKLETRRDAEADNLRWGLSQIIDLYLDHQEKILAEYCDQYNKSDIYLTRMAEANFSAIEHGAYRTQEALSNSLYEALTRLDIVINRGGELKEKAAALKEKGMSMLRGMVKAEMETGRRRAKKTA